MLNHSKLDLQIQHVHKFHSNFDFLTSATEAADSPLNSQQEVCIGSKDLYTLYSTQVRSTQNDPIVRVAHNSALHATKSIDHRHGRPRTESRQSGRSIWHSNLAIIQFVLQSCVYPEHPYAYRRGNLHR